MNFVWKKWGSPIRISSQNWGDLWRKGTEIRVFTKLLSSLEGNAEREKAIFVSKSDMLQPYSIMLSKIEYAPCIFECGKKIKIERVPNLTLLYSWDTHIHKEHFFIHPIKVFSLQTFIYFFHSLLAVNLVTPSVFRSVSNLQKRRSNMW